MEMCQTCSGKGYVLAQRGMMVKGKDGTIYTETVVTQEPCPGGCVNGQKSDRR